MMDRFVSFFKGFYRKWMAFAEKLNTFVLTIVFGGIYFLFLPFLMFFRTKDRLRLHPNEKDRTFWLDRTQPIDTLEDMQRMG